MALLTDMSKCASCGKEGNSDDMNTCNKCKSVKYCNAACKKKHRSKHKKACNRRVAELHDEALFKQPPLLHEDCPIFFLQMPTLLSGSRYMGCCGKVICNGCFFANAKRDDNKHKQLCAFCRTPISPSNEETMKRVNRRVELGDADAIFYMGVYFANGRRGLPQDWEKALELWHQAGELGNARAYCNIGSVYYYGRGVNTNKKKAKHYYELAAMKGNVVARHNLGVLDMNACRAVKHFLIAVRSGYTDSLGNIKQLYLNGIATKDDYTNALQSYQEYLGEIKSDQRDKAAAFSDEYKYY